ncbi:phage virion morphogenesis protein [Limnohabitans sp.]|uniref:phage virion morphogenesis protein n=1 Tax=Limnohabitans sp. TaxID=1907725 RepID=UPI00286F9BCB|nr:phage virion morphogenesis protein [Limnohabitans sp.]
MLHIEVVNDQRIVESLQRAAAKLTHTGPLMRAVGARLEANMRQRFDTKTDPAGRRWADIKPITRVIYRAIHGKELGGSLMERSGHLRNSIESHVLGESAVEIGPSMHYAIYHERGTPRMVRRGLVFGDVSGQGLNAQVSQQLSASDTQDVLDVVRNYVQRTMQA